MTLPTGSRTRVTAAAPTTFLSIPEDSSGLPGIYRFSWRDGNSLRPQPGITRGSLMEEGPSHPWAGRPSLSRDSDTPTHVTDTSCVYVTGGLGTPPKPPVPRSTLDVSSLWSSEIQLQGIGGAGQGHPQAGAAWPGAEDTARPDRGPRSGAHGRCPFLLAGVQSRLPGACAEWSQPEPRGSRFFRVSPSLRLRFSFMDALMGRVVPPKDRWKPFP